MEVNATLYLDEIQQAIWFYRGKVASPSTVVRAFKASFRCFPGLFLVQALGWTRKKAFHAAREASPAQQAAYCTKMQQYSMEQLVFLDEVRYVWLTCSADSCSQHGQTYLPPQIRSITIRHPASCFRSFCTRRVLFDCRCALVCVAVAYFVFCAAAMSCFGLLAHFTICGSFNTERLCQFAREYLVTLVRTP